MSRSGLLRLADARAAGRLAYELHDLPPDPLIVQTHMLTRLCELLRAQLCCYGRIECGSTETDFKVTTWVLGGWLEASARRTLSHYDNHEYARDPMAIELVRRRSALDAFTRSDVFSNTDWYRTLHWNEYRRHLGVDPCVYGGTPIDGAVIAGFGIHRGVGDRPFSARDKSLTRVLLRGLDWVFRLPDPSDRPTLPPRLRQVLWRLRLGDSIPQTARYLRLSPDSVKRYAATLYRRLGVSSRAELLALPSK